jgi:hypothetical protein
MAHSLLHPSSAVHCGADLMDAEKFVQARNMSNLLMEYIANVSATAALEDVRRHVLTPLCIAVSF